MVFVVVCNAATIDPDWDLLLFCILFSNAICGWQPSEQVHVIQDLDYSCVAADSRSGSHELDLKAGAVGQKGLLAQ